VPVAGTDPLRGSRWALVSMTRDDDTSAPPDDASRPTLEFGDDGKVYGFGGCNRYFGSYELEASGALSLGRIGATRMACPPPILDREDAFFAALEAIDRFAIAGGELTLSGANDARLVFRSAPE
jgi:heat shock protein HslJ